MARSPFMLYKGNRVLRAALLIGIAFCTQTPATAAAPKTLYWDGEHLAAIRQAPEKQPAIVREALGELVQRANAALQRGPYSVVDKEIIPPSGDKHDYLSYSRYWWPNPQTDDGLPYVRRDGQVNHDLLAKGDRVRIGNLYDDVETLSLAAYFCRNQRYANHAARLLNVWFLDAATRMNPNLQFGQAVPGRAAGRDVGIMDTRHFIRVLDAVILLDQMEVLDDEQIAGLKTWFGDYLEWLLTSELGREERAAENNHGTWYAAQAARIALFVERPDIAREILVNVRDRRITRSIGADGRQKEELGRTRALHYSQFNLSALFVLARLGEQLGVDLWNYVGENGGSLQLALDYILPFTTQPDEWPHAEMADYEFSDQDAHLLLLAATRWGDPKYLEELHRAHGKYADVRFATLVFPLPAFTENAANGGDHQVRVFDDFKIPPLNIELPDLAPYSAARVRAKIPAITNSASVLLREAKDIDLLDEAFRDARGRDLERRQNSAEPRVIVVDNGMCDLDHVVSQLADESIARAEEGIVTLRLPLVVMPEGVLLVNGQRTPTLRLSTDRGAFLANQGQFFMSDATLTSWSEEAFAPTGYVTANEFRPFFSSYFGSQTYVTSSVVQHLGFAAPTAYGFSMSSHPQRELGKPRDGWPTGILVDSEFRGLYYGFYSYEARDVAIVSCRFIDNIKYGIDPHDRSTRLIIARNLASDTQEKHGIIGSRGISESYIFENVSRGNARSGIMLDRNCVNNVVCDNKVYNNGQGIAIYESSSNLICRNLVAFNKEEGVRVRNSQDIDIRENTVVGNRDYAFQVYAKRLDDHEKRLARGDYYIPVVSAAIFSNIVAGNQGLIKASGLGRLRLSRLQQQVDADAIVQQLAVDEATIREAVTGDASNFGGDLVQLSAEIRDVLVNSDSLVEIQGIATLSE